MIAALVLLAVSTPDPEPLRNAVGTCDVKGLHALMESEPHRRAEFAAAVYGEQRAIADERTRVQAIAPTGSTAGQATVGQALALLDTRQKQLDDARTVERAWRDLLDEERADYLANCTNNKRDGK